MSRFAIRAAVLAAAVLSLSCSGDSVTQPDERPISELNQLHVTYDYPSLASTQVSFWAVKGKAVSAALWYHARAGASDSAKFVDFSVPANALATRSDGSTIAAGDSVLITLTATDPAHMMIRFEPSGLHFSASDQPTLKMFWTACGDDVNYDGKVDAADDAIVNKLSVWRQEVVGGTWSRLSSTVNKSSREEDSRLDGFSGYALMY